MGALGAHAPLFENLASFSTGRFFNLAHIAQLAYYQLNNIFM